jgi:hypothetical protein
MKGDQAYIKALSKMQQFESLKGDYKEGIRKTNTESHHERINIQTVENDHFSATAGRQLIPINFNTSSDDASHHTNSAHLSTYSHNY